MINKEFLQVVRDPSSIIIAFIFPVILLFIFGYGVNLDSERMRIGLVLEAQTPEIMSLSKAFTNSKFFDVTIGRDRREFNQQLISGHLRGLVVIPQDFVKKTLSKSQKGEIQVIADGSEPIIASYVQNYARGVIRKWEELRILDKGFKMNGPRVITESRYWYNQELRSNHFLIPGSIAIIMALIGTMLTALVIAREWERGTMEALMATPISIVEILVGKLIPYFLLGMGSMVLCVVIALLFYGLPFRGSFIAIGVVSSVFLLTALGQGLLISSLARDQFLASQIALISAFLPAFMLSGFIFDINAMPLPIRLLTHIFAARYLVTSLQVLFLTGDVWKLLLSSMITMALIGSIFFIITSRKTRKRLD